MSVCKFYKSGYCKFGSYCRNTHEQPPPVPAVVMGLPLRRPMVSPLVPPYPGLRDNLSRDFRFVVPSPTVQTDKIFYSSDSDWDERGIDDVLDEISSLAIVPCDRCGYQELKQQPAAGEGSLCLKCKEGSRKGNLDGDEDHKELEEKRKRRKKKKKPPIVSLTNLNILDYEGTPEGVKVYRMKEQQLLVDEEDNIDVSSGTTLNNNVKEKKSLMNDLKPSNKPPLLPKIEVMQNCEDKLSLKEDRDLPEMETNKVPSIVTNGQVFSANYLLPKLGLCLFLLCQSFQSVFKYFINATLSMNNRIKNDINDIMKYIESLWDETIKYFTNPKAKKYSRRRKIKK